MSPDPLGEPLAPRESDTSSLLAYGSGLPPGPASLAPASEMPGVLPYRPGYPVPPGYHAESRPATGLIVTGSVTLGLAYVTALSIALGDGFENGTGWLAVPVIGPWGAIGGRSFKCEADDTVEEARECFDGAYSEATTIAILAGDGVIQAVGLALIIAGIANRTHEIVRNDVRPLKVGAAPRPGGGVNLAVSGAF